MNEKKEVFAKELYCWRQGKDDYGIKILSALNKIIDGFNVLQCNEWEDITETIGSSSMCGIAKRCGKIYNSDELMDMAENFETIRTLLFGDKIDYTKLLDVLQDNVGECGWTEEMAKQKREANQEVLEEKRKRGAASSKYGRFSTKIPQRLKKQLEELKKSGNYSIEDVISMIDNFSENIKDE